MNQWCLTPFIHAITDSWWGEIVSMPKAVRSKRLPELSALVPGNNTIAKA